MLIEPLSPESADERERALFAAVRERFGRDLPPVAVMARHPDIMAAVNGFEKALLRADRLPPRLTHLINLKVAALLGCSFCIDIGSHLARQHGLSSEALAELPDFRASSRFSDAERAALELAEVMTVGDGVVDDGLEQRLCRHFDPEQLVELLAGIAWENFRSRFNRAAGLQAAGFCPIPDRAASEHRSG